MKKAVEVVSMLMTLILDDTLRSQMDVTRKRKTMKERIKKGMTELKNPDSKQFKCCLLLNVVL